MHLAEGDIEVSRARLSQGERGVDETVGFMMKMAKGQWGMRSAKIRALALNIINEAGVGDKDYYGMIEAIHNWVRDEIRYLRDPVNQETLSFPEELAFNSKAGDCLDENTRLLTPTGYVRIADVKPGDVIQGKLGWTKVQKVWDKGVLPVSRYDLDNGGYFVATDDHRCFLQDGSERRAADLRVRDPLLGPSSVTMPGDGSLTDDDAYFIGLYLADGWEDGNRICIAGKDGFVKEAQKRWAATYAAGKGWATSWHARYLRVYIPKTDPLYPLLRRGALAPEKELPVEVLAAITPSAARRLLDGLLADSHDPCVSRRALGAEAKRKPRLGRGGVCVSTTSPALADQIRLLLRLQGFSCRITRVDDHGGLGQHPVYRIYPRYYRDKPARLEQSTPAGTRHVWDIQTVDHGIYLPDADIVVHNCDDKTILEIALLGSIGIRAWPVVIGVHPGRWSHVYLDVQVPEGGRPGRHAGEILHADPIMREWSLGREAPADKITQKKTYEHLAGLSGLEGYPMDLGAYATAPSYLGRRGELEATQVERVLKSRLTDTASRGEILNAPKVEEQNTDEGMDAMFMAAPAIFMRSTPLDVLSSLGPVNEAEAAGSVAYIPEGRRYVEEAAPGRRSFKPRARPVSVFARKRQPPTAPNTVMIDKLSTEADELYGIGAYIDSIMGDALGGAGTSRKRAVAATVMARRALNRGVAKARRLGAGFLPGLGAIDAKVREAERVVSRGMDDEALDAAKAVAILEDAGVLRHLDDAQIPFALKVAAITPLTDADVARPDADLAGLGNIFDKMGNALTRLAKKTPLKSKAVRKALMVAVPAAGISTMMAAGAGVKGAKNTLKSTFGEKWGNRLIRAGAVTDVAVASVLTGGIGGGALGLTLNASGGLMAMGVGKGIKEIARIGASKNKPGKSSKSSATPLVNAGTPLPETTTPPYYIPNVVDLNSGVDQGYGYNYGYGDQSQYGAPYAAPPVDTFGPESMGPAEESFDTSGSASSFTTEVNAYGDQAPASWDDSGSSMPSDVVDDDDQSMPEGGDVPMDYADEDLPTERPRRLRQARPAVELEEGPEFEAEVETEGPEYETEIDEEGRGFATVRDTEFEEPSADRRMNQGLAGPAEDAADAAALATARGKLAARRVAGSRTVRALSKAPGLGAFEATPTNLLVGALTAYAVYRIFRKKA